MSPIELQYFSVDLYFRSWSISMATDCGFLPIFLKFEFNCFQGSIQLCVARMVPELDQLSNALLAETGAKRLIKTCKQVNNM